QIVLPTDRADMRRHFASRSNPSDEVFQYPFPGLYTRPWNGTGKSPGGLWLVALSSRKARKLEDIDRLFFRSDDDITRREPSGSSSIVYSSVPLAPSAFGFSGCRYLTWDRSLAYQNN